MYSFKSAIVHVLFSSVLFFSATNIYASSNHTVSSLSSTQVVVGVHDFDYPLLLVSHNDGHAWSTVKDITYMPNRADLRFVSCTNGHCLAGGTYDQKNLIHLPFLVTSHDNGLSWCLAKNLPILPLSGLHHLSCIENQCVAVGGYVRHMYLQNLPLVLVSNDSGDSWSFINNISGLPSDYSVTLQTVHCTKDVCVAGGDYSTNDSGPLLPLLIVSKDKGQSWTFIKQILELPSPLKLSGIEAVHCTDEVCIAVGFIKESKFPLLLISKDKGESWTFVKQYTGLSSGLNRLELHALSCSGHFCAAVGEQLDVVHSRSQPILFTSNNSGESWSLVKNIAGFPVEISNGLFSTISCNHSTCVAAGSYFPEHSTDWPPFALPLFVVSNDQGKTWSMIKNISRLPGDYNAQMVSLSAVKCAANSCLAVGSLSKWTTHIPLILLSDAKGQSWTMVHDINGLPKDPILRNLYLTDK